MPSFILLSGSMITGDKNPDGTRITYRRGDRVESSKPLDKMFPNKFRPADGSTPLPQETPDDTLSSMTVEELKKFAADEEIDLGGATKKADILAVIRKAGWSL